MSISKILPAYHYDVTDIMCEEINHYNPTFWAAYTGVTPYLSFFLSLI